MTTRLAQIAQQIVAERGETMASAGQKAGFLRQTLQKIVGAGGEVPTGFPRVASLKRLAIVLGMSETRTVLAYAEMLGMDVDADRAALAAELPEGIDLLSEEDRMYLLKMIREFVSLRTGRIDG